MTASVIDTHAHLLFPQFDEDREELINSLAENGVAAIINVGYSLESSLASVELAQKYQYVFAAVGVHPEEAASFSDQKLKTLITNPRIVAIGECGLDYYRNSTPKDTQKKLFRAQLELAQEANLPVIIHSREAFDETFEILKEYRVRAVFHCFTYGIPEAKQLIDAGYYLSFTGIVTYKNALNIQEVARNIPLGKFWIETDSPWLAPLSRRGKRNEPKFVWEVAEKIAELRYEPLEAIATATTQNAVSFFKLAI